MLATRNGAATLSIISVSLLIVLKVVASTLTGSISIRADAFHSVFDLTGVIIGYIGIRVSSKPPDEKHAFGHGKAENIASMIIAGLIFIAAGTIFYEAVRRLLSGQTLELLTAGIHITAAALVINGITSWYALRVARATDSVALEASARDMRADMLSSAAVLVGLLLVNFTGLVILDPIVAMLVAILIVRTAYVTIKKSLGDLLDVKLPEAEERAIESAIMEHVGEIISYHKLRTRKAGNQRHIDLHLVVPGNMSVEDSHQICDHLEEGIEHKLQNTSVTIHVEPCDENCRHCPAICQNRKNGP